MRLLASAGSVVACLLIVPLEGCDKAATVAPTAKLSGKVVFKGQPLPGGNITFRPKGGGGPISTGIAPDGTYQVPLPFTGEATVTVMTTKPGTDTAKGAEKADKSILDKQLQQTKEKTMSPEEKERWQKMYGGQAAGKYVALPGKYRDHKTTPLTVTIKGGDQVEDFNLTD
jgi:hypothetical protein